MSDNVPRYAEIRRELETLIRSGEWPPGHRVPSEHELMEQYACSRMTVNKALSALASAGLIVRKRRSGSHVASPKSEETVLEIHDIKAEIIASGKRYTYELLQRKLRTANQEDVRHLGTSDAPDVIALQARHLADDCPYVLEQRLINLAAVPDAQQETFDATPSGSWLLERIPWTDAEHSIRAEAASPAVASKLEVPKGAACLVVERRTWHAGTPITHVRLVYPGERHRLVARFRPGPHFRQP